MDPIPYAHLEKGTFLIATPDVENGIFSRSVLLLCEHSPQGSFALVINKPLEMDLPEEIITPDKLANQHIAIRAGGPVQTNQMMILHSHAEIPEQTIEIAENIFLGGDLQFLQEAISQTDGPHLHLCFGYTGWQGGELEREFLDGNWFIWPASSQHLFETEAAVLWQTLLKEMGGKYATLSMIPEDLSVN